MKSQIFNTSQERAVKIAGFMFLFSFIVPTLNWAFVLSKFIDPDNVIATADNILANKLLFRIGITVELIMSLGLIVLAVALYTILKQINRELSLLALLVKTAEAVLVAVMVIVSFIALHLLNGSASIDGINHSQFQAMAGILLNQHTSLYSILMVFLGIDMMLFSYLLLVSRYIPRQLAGFGILSFALVFIHAVMYILAPTWAIIPINQIIFWVPSGVFEIIIGFWLLIKGINKLEKRK